jgi:hypothetical protein
MATSFRDCFTSPASNSESCNTSICPGKTAITSRPNRCRGRMLEKSRLKI